MNDTHFCSPSERDVFQDADTFEFEFVYAPDENAWIYLVNDGQAFLPQFRLWSDGTICQCDLDGFRPPATPVYEDLEIEMLDGTIVHLDKATCECFQIPKNKNDLR